MKSKSVLIIVPHLGVGGTEVQTLNIISALISGGYSVSVLCLYRNIPEMVEAIERIGAKVIIVSPQYNNYETSIKYPKRLSLISFLYQSLNKALKVCSPDVIHVQYMTPGATVILMLKYIFGKKNIIATTHTTADIYSRNGLRLIEYLVNNCLQAFQCITLNAESEYFGNSRMYDGDISIGYGSHFTIYNSLPPYIEITDQPKILRKEDIITLGVVSRLEPIKGMDLVIPAFAKLSMKNRNIRLLVIGDGSLASFIKSQAKNLSVDTKVTFLGRKSPQELHPYYDQINLLLMPSRSEGFGLTAIEGMARGCVPVVSNVGGLSEVVNFDSLLLHSPDNIDDMVSKLEYLIKNPDLINELSKKSIKRAKDFSNDKFNTNILSLYKKIV